MTVSFKVAEQPLHMSPAEKAGPVTGTILSLGSYEKFQASFRDEKKGQRSWDEFWREIRETEQTWRDTKMITFGAIIDLTTRKTVSLQSNGMLMMWKIPQAMRDDAIRTARMHPVFIPVFISGPLTEIPLGKTESTSLFIRTHRKFYKGFT